MGCRVTEGERAAIAAFKGNVTRVPEGRAHGWNDPWAGVLHGALSRQNTMLVPTVRPNDGRITRWHLAEAKARGFFK